MESASATKNKLICVSVYPLAALRICILYNSGSDILLLVQVKL